MKIRTDYGNWNNIWEDAENVIRIDETVETEEEDKIQQTVN